MEVFLLTFALIAVIFLVLTINRFVHQKGRHAFAEQKIRSRTMKRVEKYPEKFKIKF